MWLMGFPGVCRASGVQGKGFRHCAESSSGADDGLSDDDGDEDDDDDLNGNSDPD
jgi:hypothetical protein